MKNRAGRQIHRSRQGPSLAGGLHFLFAPLPLSLVNRTFGRMMAAVSAKRPELFERLTGHYHKKILIDPTNLPFVIELSPDPLRPRLRAHRRGAIRVADARISGSFLTLLGLIDGRLDGDALFFSRDIKVEGDTEAVVSLRNALDDIEGTIAQDVASFFGPPGRAALSLTRRIGNRVSRA